MNKRLFQGLGFGLAAAASLAAVPKAYALNTPAAIQIDGGPLGNLALSGGSEGFVYYLSGTNDHGNLPGTNKSNGAYVGDTFIQVEKTSGILQFTVQVAALGGAFALGTAPGQATIKTYVTGPLRNGYITIAPPGSPVTISAGQLGSLEGYESTLDLFNANQFTTTNWYVENSNSRGVSAAYAQGPLSATVTYGDGWDTGVFNFLQALLSYSFDANNIASLYYGGNLGTTGLYAFGYGGGTVESYGAQFANSKMLGGYYQYTSGNLNLVPEVQYQYAKAQARLGIAKPTYNLGVDLFADYSFAASPYSIGAWGEFFTSHASAASAASTQSWFFGPNAQGVGFSVTPTWQYKNIFARTDLGYIYLLHNTSTTGATYGYGDSGTGRSNFTGTIEAGILF
jgi:hypothetical protein